MKAETPLNLTVQTISLDIDDFVRKKINNTNVYNRVPTDFIGPLNIVASNHDWVLLSDWMSV